MVNLIKMDIFKIFKFKTTYIAWIAMIVMTFFMNVLIPLISKLVDSEYSTVTEFSAAIYNPMWTTFMFLAVASFSYRDIGGGYIKNIAGQLANRGNTVISKLAAIAVHNFVFLILASAVNCVSLIISSDITDDGKLGLALASLLLKWFLSLGYSAVILLFTNGIKSNVVGYIITVLLCFNVVGTVYNGLNFILHKIGLSESFDISLYGIDTHFDTANFVKDDSHPIMGIVIGLVYLVLFTCLTITIFNKKDVK